MKTKPIGVRFDEEDLEFIKKREGIRTPQQVIYFLMSEYMKIYRVEKPSIFIAGSKESFDGKESNLYELDEALQREESKRKLIRTFEQYRQLKLDCEDQEDWIALSIEIRDAPNLSTKQKQLLLN